ncbi:MAG: N-acetylmuramoyl-L-alanine amidase [Candidatus Rifleibacteriota bacterium]
MLSKIKNLQARLFFSLLLIILLALPTTGQDGFISARKFAESQGISYQWFPIQKMLVMRQGLKTVKVSVNKLEAKAGGKTIYLPAAPVIREGQVMVPATALVKIFSGDLEAFSKPPASIQNQKQNQLDNQPPSIKPPTQTTPQPEPESEPKPGAPAGDKAVLVALRHSVREDHTRVVLEFNKVVTFKGSLKDNTYKLTISGCKNLIPRRRSNPVGRDIKKLDINSGPDREGLILTFKLAQTKNIPRIETVNDPFRMIVNFYDSSEKSLQATATSQISSLPEKEEEETQKVVPNEEAPEINIEVPLASLKQESFKNRTIVIDAGHGGDDLGYTYPGRIPEKEITLSIAKNLAETLKEIGLNSVLTRNKDVSLSHSQRISLANRYGSDLFVSIHVGGSKSPDKSGVATFIYDKTGTYIAENSKPLSENTIYKEWLKNTRFDLANFLARQVNQQLIKHLKVKNRGIQKLPLLPLKYIMNPAILVEVGMLSEQTEGKNLLSKNYHQAIARSIANGVVDFFNGIVIKP